MRCDLRYKRGTPRRPSRPRRQPLAAVVDRSSRNSAAALLCIGYVRHYAWALAEPGMRGVASKGLAAAAIVVVLWWLVAHLRRTLPVLAVAAWLTFEEVQVASCSAAYLAKPWPIEVGRPMCSALLGVDIGSATLVVVAVLACLLAWDREDSQ